MPRPSPAQAQSSSPCLLLLRLTCKETQPRLMPRILIRYSASEMFYFGTQSELNSGLTFGQSSHIYEISLEYWFTENGVKVKPFKVYPIPHKWEKYLLSSLHAS